MSDEDMEIGGQRDGHDSDGVVGGDGGGGGGGGAARAAGPEDAGMATEISRILGKFSHYNKPEDPVMKRRKSKHLEAMKADQQQRKDLSTKVQNKRQQKAKDLYVPEVSLDTKERALRKIATQGASCCCCPGGEGGAGAVSTVAVARGPALGLWCWAASDMMWPRFPLSGWFVDFFRHFCATLAFVPLQAW
jgi:hypothetical protein